MLRRRSAGMGWLVALCLIVTIGAIIVGVNIFLRHSAVTCNGKPMTLSQTCDHYVYGSNSLAAEALRHFTYNQQKAYQQAGKTWSIIGFVIIALVALLLDIKFLVSAIFGTRKPVESISEESTAVSADESEALAPEDAEESMLDSIDESMLKRSGELIQVHAEESELEYADAVGAEETECEDEDDVEDADHHLVQESSDSR